MSAVEFDGLGHWTCGDCDTSNPEERGHCRECGESM